MLSRRIILVSCLTWGIVAILPASAAEVRSAETGMLYVASKPTGATILIEGAEKGRTPALIRDVPAGDVTVTLRSAGCEISRTVKVSAAKVAKLDIQFELTASLTVITEPLEAEILLGQGAKGTTPLTIDDLAPGTYQLTIRKKGFKEAQRAVTLKAGDKTLLEVPLEKRKEPRVRLYSLFVEATRHVQPLIHAARYEEAAKALEKIEGSRELVRQKIERMKLLANLKAKIIERATSLTQKPKLKQLAPDAKFSGTIFSVDKRGLMISESNMHVQAPWMSLSPSTYYRVARYFIGKADSEDRLQLAVLAFENRDIESTRRELELAKRLGVKNIELERMIEGLLFNEAALLVTAKKQGLETAAQVAWQRIQEDIAKEEMSNAAAEDLLEKLAAFEKEHGGTESAAEKREELATAKAKAGDVLIYGTITTGTPAAVEKLARPVTLTPPYTPSYKGAPIGKLSVQYAVIDILKQVGLRYDWKESFKNTDPLCRRWVYPKMVNMSCGEALRGILQPVGLTYELVGEEVILRRK